MHRLPSNYAVIRFKLASWALMFMGMVIPLTLGVLAYSVLTGDRDFTQLVLWVLAGMVILGILQWIYCLGAHCPLCHTRSLAHNACAKHRHAKRLLGSYRLRVASVVIFRKYFRCPYCGEFIAMQARLGSPRGPSRRY